MCGLAWIRRGSARIGFGNWEQVGMALEAHTLLPHQPGCRKLEHRVIAANSNTGISMRSNAATVML